MRVCCEIPQSAVDDHWGPPCPSRLWWPSGFGLGGWYSRISGHGVFTHQQPLAAGLGERWWASREPWTPGPLWLPPREMENKQGHVEDLCFLFFFLRFSEFGTILFLFYVLVFWLGDMWDLSSSTRDQACTRWFGRQSLNPWAARGVYFL